MFYTRKSLISDAVQMIKAGTDGLFIKPTGKNDEDTRRLTGEFAPALIASLIKIIQSKIDGLSLCKDFYAKKHSQPVQAISGLINCWKEFKNN